MAAKSQDEPLQRHRSEKWGRERGAEEAITAVKTSEKDMGGGGALKFEKVKVVEFR